MAALRSPTDARGQLLLSGAFVLAVLFVVLALALNTAIFTANQGSQGSDIDGHQVRQLRADTARATAGLLDQRNAVPHATYDGLVAEARESIGHWSDLTGRHEALTGGMASVSLIETTNGSRIVQRNESRPLTNASEATNWTLADGVAGVRNVELTVTNASLVAADDDTVAELLAAEAFHVVLTTDDGDRWRVFVYAGDGDDGADDAGDVLVRVVDPGGTLSTPCRVTPSADGRVHVDGVDATVGGHRCEPIETLPPAAAIGTVEYHYGANAAGTYSLLVDEYRSIVDDADYGPDGTTPSVDPAIYGATVRLDYVSKSVEYRTTITVVPGETDG